MNVKAFFVATLQTALDLSIATPEDVLKHVTPDVLAEHLPRPLWARLLTACVGAPKVDAQLVIETIGVPNLCEHVPSPIIWACIAEIASRSLGKPLETPASSEEPIVLRPKSVTTPPPPPQPSRNRPLTSPPPEVITKPSNPPVAPLPKLGPTIPSPSSSNPSQALSDIVAELEAEGARDDKATTPPPTRGRIPTQQRFRQSQTGSGIGRLAPSNTRRPQAAITSRPTGVRRGETDVEDIETETAVGADWRTSLDVEDEQLVDWKASDDTLNTDDIDNGRKR